MTAKPKATEDVGRVAMTADAGCRRCDGSGRVDVRRNDGMIGPGGQSWTERVLCDCVEARP
jgi:hypothetical protein